MKLKFFSVALLATLVLTGCTGGSSSDSSSLTIKETKNMKELVHDYSVGNQKAESASITSHQLTVTDSKGSKSVYDLPEDEFFVSIAPYVSQTHP
ncbi:hypothetical protein EIZ39_11050 [Ammoniphilus sp. CFH 90114]|nr:hypothetical protein EIZ39_11050 [Ammoniphilus sp. CFH 90114]